PLLSTSPLSTPLLSTPLLSTPLLSTPLLSTPLLSTPLLSTPLLSTPLLSTSLLSTSLLSTSLLGTDLLLQFHAYESAEQGCQRRVRRKSFLMTSTVSAASFNWFNSARLNQRASTASPAGWGVPSRGLHRKSMRT